MAPHPKLAKVGEGEKIFERNEGKKSREIERERERKEIKTLREKERENGRAYLLTTTNQVECGLRLLVSNADHTQGGLL